jgi:hypothetical protein
MNAILSRAQLAVVVLVEQLQYTLQQKHLCNTQRRLHLMCHTNKLVSLKHHTETAPIYYVTNIIACLHRISECCKRGNRCRSAHR